MTVNNNATKECLDQPMLRCVVTNDCVSGGGYRNKVDAGAATQYYHMEGVNESGNEGNSLGDKSTTYRHSFAWLVKDKLPSTVGPSQAVEYPLSPEQVDSEESRPTVELWQTWAIATSLFESSLILFFVFGHLVRPGFLLVLAINRVEDVNAAKTFRPFDDKRTDMGTVYHHLGHLTVRRYRKLLILLGQGKEMCLSVISYVAFVLWVKGYVVI